MQYKDLKEITLKDWDGKPFYAITIDGDSAELYGYDIDRLKGKKKGVRIEGYVNEMWRDDDCVNWAHAYPIDSLNKTKFEEYCNSKPKRMTNRQLAMWLAKGNGQWRYMDTDVICAHTEFHYDVRLDNQEFNGNICVRKWDSEEWVEPTVDLLEGC